NGIRRLDDPEDFVRMEIAAALKRKIRVIPVLVDHASMPSPSDLPEALKPLARRNAISFTHGSFDVDCQFLAAAIKEVLEQAAAEEQERLNAERRQRDAKEQLEAEQRDKEPLEAEARQKEEKERLEAKERLEKEREKLEADRQTHLKAMESTSEPQT